MMDWEKLISTKRWGQKAKKTINRLEERSQFQRDYDRIVFSSPFRRLQNKTQVFPLPGSIFVHNRLTHSLEVSCVGRTLGNILSHHLTEKHPDNPIFTEIDMMIAAACLAHDMGNPAFGHSGESAISAYFKDGEGQQYEKELTPEQWADFVHFEGNANAFRILTHSFKSKEDSPFALTYSTLAALVKYPCESINGHNKTNIYTKKYGFFQSEKESFEEIASQLGLIQFHKNPFSYYRHPITFLVEAADDICYNIIDMEDAHRLKIMNDDTILGYFEDLMGDKKLKETNIARYKKISDANERVSFLRAKAISTLIMECSQVFSDNLDAIMNGTFNNDLISCIKEPYRTAIEKIKKISGEKIYNNQSVIEIEVAGYKVIGGLLEEFIPAILNPNTHYNTKLLSLMPVQFEPLNTDTYSKIQSVLDFISGMTDVYALDLYRKIKGISFSTVKQ